VYARQPVEHNANCIRAVIAYNTGRGTAGSDGLKSPWSLDERSTALCLRTRPTRTVCGAFRATFPV